MLSLSAITCRWLYEICARRVQYSYVLYMCQIPYTHKLSFHPPPLHHPHHNSPVKSRIPNTYMVNVISPSGAEHFHMVQRSAPSRSWNTTTRIHSAIRVALYSTVRSSRSSFCIDNTHTILPYNHNHKTKFPKLPIIHTTTTRDHHIVSSSSELFDRHRYIVSRRAMLMGFLGGSSSYMCI